MALATTEAVNANARGLDLQQPATILRLLADAQIAASRSVLDTVPAIEKASRIAAGCLSSGGRLFYAAAGSSGLMALGDALELPGTYGIDSGRVIVLIAGGRQALVDLAGAPEDDPAEVVAALRAHNLSKADCLVALSASGSTPYAVSALEEAMRAGAATVGIANNAGTPLVTKADIGVVLATPPEMIAGSTRMGAGTAQKIALNMFSTMIAIHLGHVHDGYMVNLRADNIKLRGRAARIVAAIVGCHTDEAAALLERTGGQVKPAILLGAGASDARAANDLLESNGQKLRPALARLKEGSIRSHRN